MHQIFKIKILLICLMMALFNMSETKAGDFIQSCDIDLFYVQEIEKQIISSRTVFYDGGELLQPHNVLPLIFDFYRNNKNQDNNACHIENFDFVKNAHIKNQLKVFFGISSVYSQVLQLYSAYPWSKGTIDDFADRFVKILLQLGNASKGCHSSSMYANTYSCAYLTFIRHQFQLHLALAFPDLLVYNQGFNLRTDSYKEVYGKILLAQKTGQNYIEHLFFSHDCQLADKVFCFYQMEGQPDIRSHLSLKYYSFLTLYSDIVFSAKSSERKIDMYEYFRRIMFYLHKKQEEEEVAFPPVYRTNIQIEEIYREIKTMAEQANEIQQAFQTGNRREDDIIKALVLESEIWLREDDNHQANIIENAESHPAQNICAYFILPILPDFNTHSTKFSDLLPGYEGCVEMMLTNINNIKPAEGVM